MAGQRVGGGKDPKRGQPVLMCPTAFWLLLVIELLMAVGGSMRMYGEARTRSGMEVKEQVAASQEVPAADGKQTDEKTTQELEEKKAEAAERIHAGEWLSRTGECMLVGGKWMAVAFLIGVRLVRKGRPKRPRKPAAGK